MQKDLGGGPGGFQGACLRNHRRRGKSKPLLEKSFGAPTATEDGATVAREIELEEKFENVGAQMVAGDVELSEWRKATEQDSIVGLVPLVVPLLAVFLCVAVFFIVALVV